MARRSAWVSRARNGVLENTGQASSSFHRNRGHFIGVATSFSDGIGMRESRAASTGEVSQLPFAPSGLCDGADEAPATDNGFALGHRFVARVMLHRPVHEYSLVARPHVVFADRSRLLVHAELLEQ